MKFPFLKFSLPIFLLLIPLFFFSFVSHVNAQGFICDDPDANLVGLMERCGVYGPEGQLVRCFDSALICTSNKYNTCSSNVCLLRIGEIDCDSDGDAACEGGAVCKNNRCVLDDSGDFGGIVGVSTTDIRGPIRRIINIILGFLGMLTVAMVLYGGAIWLTAAGNEEKVEKGKDILIWASIGAVVISIVWTIASYILSIGESLS